MKRYQNSKKQTNRLKRGTKNDLYNISSFKSIVYSTIPKSDSDVYIITQEGDRLDLLANQFYGDPTLWWYIARANNLKFITLETGITLRIPTSTNYATGT